MHSKKKKKKKNLKSSIMQVPLTKAEAVLWKPYGSVFMEIYIFITQSLFGQWKASNKILIDFHQ